MSELMTVDEIAEMWRIPRRQARDRLTKLPGFPRPAPGSTAKHQVWLRSEVRAFARGKLGSPAPAQIPHRHAFAQ